jgi:hypothetical protein
MEMKSTDQPTLYPSLEPQQPSAPNSYDNLPDSAGEERNAALQRSYIQTASDYIRLMRY